MYDVISPRELTIGRRNGVGAVPGPRGFLRARRRPFIINEIIYAARWGVELPFHRDAKIHMPHD